MARWLKLTDPKLSWRPHILSEELVATIEKELFIGLEEPVQIVYMDCAGAATVNAPLRRVFLPGLVVELPEQDCVYYLEKIKNLQVRSGGYYKLHTPYHCLVLNASQKQAMETALEEIKVSLNSSEAISKALKNIEKIHELLRETNELLLSCRKSCTSTYPL